MFGIFLDLPKLVGWDFVFFRGEKRVAEWGEENGNGLGGMLGLRMKG